MAYKKYNSNDSRLATVEKKVLGELKHKDVVYRYKATPPATDALVKENFHAMRLFENIKLGTDYNERIGNEILVKSIELTCVLTNRQNYDYLYTAVVKPNVPILPPLLDNFTGFSNEPRSIGSGVQNYRSMDKVDPYITAGVEAVSNRYDKRHGWIASENLFNGDVHDANIRPHYHKVKFPKPMVVKFEGSQPTMNEMYLVIHHGEYSKTVSNPLDIQVSARIKYYDP